MEGGGVMVSGEETAPKSGGNGGWLSVVMQPMVACRGEGVFAATGGGEVMRWWCCDGEEELLGVESVQRRSVNTASESALRTSRVLIHRVLTCFASKPQDIGDKMVNNTDDEMVSSCNGDVAGTV